MCTSSWDAMKMWVAVMSLALAMVAVAQMGHVRSVIFPEASSIALAAWVLRHPGWLRKPGHLVVLPTACAAMGVFMNHLGLSVIIREVLVLWVVLSVLVVTRSSFSPAISAGILPVVLNIHSWVFVGSVGLTTGIIWVSVRGHRDDAIRLPSPSWPAIASFAVVTTLWIVWAGVFGVRDVVLPPLMVFLYESMKSQPKSLANVSREIAVLVVAAGTAAWGTSVLAYPIEVAMLALTVATLTMLVLKTWVAPAFAVALLPLVIPMSPVSKFPLLVAMISASAAGIGLVIQRWVPCDIGIAPQHP